MGNDEGFVRWARWAAIVSRDYRPVANHEGHHLEQNQTKIPKLQLELSQLSRSASRSIDWKSSSEGGETSCSQDFTLNYLNLMIWYTFGTDGV